jgi:Fe-S-cluster-containing dehydrogenase component/formate-dependent nitrite reductase membrane component NrfD
VRYGFVIDQNRCIGCHACTVACKEEHSVPVGVFRTWVKYIEKGEFPNSSRHFGVMRCNHCEAAPCVEICPTIALHRRPDGIVDFDNSRCIGCKSCMQACPYDALYIDPNNNTAAKCNFCAHRVELNLEPACVIVCPTRSIIAGDLDDPQCEVGRIVATQKVAVRKPNKGTEPKLFYAGIEGDFLQPTMMEQQASHLWAERAPQSNPHGLEHLSNGAKPAPGTARVVYDVAHKQPWGLIPAFYLWTKSIAAGILIVAAILCSVLELPIEPAAGPLLTVAAPIAALVFLAITTILLIADLHRWDRFYYILTKPNWSSWLVRGTWILIVYGVLALAWLARGWFSDGAIPAGLRWATAAAAACSACYSAFLFAQAKGRDLWQSPLFLWHLLVQAIAAGAAAMILLTAIAGLTPLMISPSGGREIVHSAEPLLLAAMIVNLLMVLGEVHLTPPSEEVRRAHDILTKGSLRNRFWYGVVLGGALIPTVLLAFLIGRGAASLALDELVAALALLGAYIFDELWIAAGQAVPLS